MRDYDRDNLQSATATLGAVDTMVVEIEAVYVAGFPERLAYLNGFYDHALERRAKARTLLDTASDGGEMQTAKSYADLAHMEMRSIYEKLFPAQASFAYRPV